MWVTNLASLVLLAAAASAASAATSVSPASTATPASPATPASAAPPAPADPVLSSQAGILASGSASLGLSLYRRLAQEEGAGNILLSPVVVASSLGLVALGGGASTASQVHAVLSAGAVKEDQLHAGLAELLAEVSDPATRNLTWKISSRLYGPSAVSFTDAFVRSSKKHYSCGHFKINFRDKKSAVRSINAWAAKATDGRLAEVTKDVQQTDGAMIVNAMFFKPHWDEQFHHKMVDDRGFLVSRSFTVAVPMMHRTGLYDFHEDTLNRLFVLRMPLALRRSSLVLIMPYGLEPLDRLEKLLTQDQLDAWTSRLESTAVAVSLPKVSMDVSHNLQKHLGALGLTEAVDKTKADLSNITGKKDLYLANLFHASALEWTTEGNAVDPRAFSADKLKDPQLFYADHPFIFLVKDVKTGSILFMGRLVRPKGDKMRDEL